MTKEQVFARLTSTTTLEEWDAARDAIREACSDGRIANPVDGYPPYWSEEVQISGFARSHLRKIGVNV